MASDDRTPTACPTCGKVLIGPAPVRYHHAATHDLSLTGVEQDRWPEYVEEHADEIENPSGSTFRERDLAPRHPAYTNDGEDGREHHGHGRAE